jgi:DNA-binding MarR family transcriptional regulator
MGTSFNLAQLLRIPFQALVTELHERLAAAGFGDIRPIHTLIFAFVSSEGIRLHELVERMQSTKQNVNYLVNALEGMGYVERVPDPADGRGKIVRLTKRGEANSLAGSTIIQNIEQEWANQLGEETMTHLRTLLEQLVIMVQQQSSMQAATDSGE